MELKTLITDKNFLALPQTERAKVVERISSKDIKFMGLPEEEKIKVLNRVVSYSPKQEPPMKEAEPVKKELSTFENVVGSAATLADMAAGALVGVAETAGELSQVAFNKLTGKKEAAQKAVASVAPMGKLTGGYSMAVDQLLGKDVASTSTLGAFLGKIGEKIEGVQTSYAKGDPEKAATAKIATDTIMNFVLPASIAGGVKAIKTMKGKPLKTVAESKDYFNTREGENSLRAKLKEVDPTMPKEQVEATISKTQESLVEIDKRINAEKKAHELMTKGASKKEVEFVIKKNPLVGEVMEEIRTRRAQQQEALKYTAQEKPTPQEPSSGKSVEEFGPIEEIEAAPAPKGDLEESSLVNNASGESAASVEAINRLAQEKASGALRSKINTQSGEVTPYTSAADVDMAAKGPDIIVQKDPTTGKHTVLSQGDKVNPGAIEGAIARATSKLEEHPFSKKPPIKKTETDYHDPILPKELAGAKPRYSFGAKSFELQFEGDLDKAAYIIGKATELSKRDEQYLNFVKRAKGISTEEARAYGRQVRAEIKRQAKQNLDTQATTLKIQKQTGEIDPKLAIALGATATGATIGAAFSEDKLLGAAFGGLLGFAGPKVAQALLIDKVPVKNSPVGSFFKALGEGADKGFGFLMTRIENQSPRLAKEALSIESKIQVDSFTAISVADDFFTYISRDLKEQAPMIKNMWLNGKVDALKEAVTSTKNTLVIESFNSMLKTLDILGKELSSRGLIKGVIEDYLPRMVKDREGLLQAMDLSSRTFLEKSIREATVKKGSALDDVEFSDIVNKYMRKRVPPGAAKPGFTKGRVFDQVSEELQKFYYDPVETYHSYVYKAINELHTADFFGRSKLVVDGKLDVDGSIGNKVMELLHNKEITFNQVEVVQDLLETRYKFGNQIANKYVQEYKNWTTGALLADISSSFQNIGDLALAPFVYGAKPALGAIVEKLTGKTKLTVEDYGLVNHISEEFVSTTKSKVYVDKVMKMAGWKILDPMGKEVFLNSSLRRAQDWSKSEAGIRQLKQRYGDAWGADLPNLIVDLQMGRITENTRLMAFWDVVRHQPLTRLQRSEFASRNPNVGGLVLQFKSFMLAQANLVRVEAYNNIKAGNYRTGLYKLASLGVGYGLAGATNKQIQNWLLGRNEEFSGVDLFWNTMKTFGLTEYTYKKAAQGDVKGALASVVLPPTSLLEGWVKTDKEGGTSLDEYGVTRKVPVVGKEIAERYLKEDKKASSGYNPTP